MALENSGDVIQKRIICINSLSKMNYVSCPCEKAQNKEQYDNAKFTTLCFFHTIYE